MFKLFEILCKSFKHTLYNPKTLFFDCQMSLSLFELPK